MVLNVKSLTTEENERPILPAALRGQYQWVSTLYCVGNQRMLLLERLDGSRFVLKSGHGVRAALLQREAHVLGRLRGPGFPALVRAFEEGGAFHLLRAWVPGTPLTDCAALGEREIARIGRQASRIIAQLHRQNPPLVHRDIAPRSFIRTPSGQLVLMDLQSARPVGGEAASGLFDTPGCDTRADVWGLGMLLTYLYRGDFNAQALLEDVGKTRLPAGMLRVIRRCVEVDPARRCSLGWAERALGRRIRQMDRAPQTHAAFQRAAAVCALTAAFGLALVFSPAFRQWKPLRAVLRLVGQKAAASTFRSPEIAQAAAAALGKPVRDMTIGDLLSVQSIQILSSDPPTGLEDLILLPNLKEITLNGHTLQDQ